MLDWIENHDYNLPLYLHEFKAFAGNTIFLAGQEFKLCSKSFNSIKKQKLHTQKFEGLYKLDNGNILDCHEWFDPSWEDDDPEPFGAIYYDIYEPSAMDEDDPISLDGGVIGYSKTDTLKYFGRWLEDCKQGSIIEKIGETGMMS